MTLATTNKSAPSYMFIVNNKIDVFKGVSYHEEAQLVAEGLLYGNWSPLVEQNLLLDSKPLRLDYYQKAHLRDDRCKVTEKSRRIGYTTAEVLKKTLKSQFIPIPLHMVSLTQKHTNDAMHLHNVLYDQFPARIRAKRILDRIDEKHYLLMGNKKGSHIRSEMHAHASSSLSIRGLTGDVSLDEFAFYKTTLASQILKAVTPLLGTTYTSYDDAERAFEINIISTHFGDLTLFNEIIQKSHKFGRKAYNTKLPWTVCPRVCQNIHEIAVEAEEFLEEMCCIPLSDKFTPFPSQLYDRLLKDIEFDQNGIVVERDAHGKVLPFDRSKYNFISVGWDYASMKAETAGFGFGVRGRYIDPIFLYRMRPEQFRGSISEDDIWAKINETSSILRPDYLGYDATGVGQYLSRVLFDPAYGFGDDRRPRTNAYPFAEGAEPVQITTDIKNSNVTKLQVAMRSGILSALPHDREIMRQLRMFKRSVTSGGTIRYAAEGKGKNPKSLDDIVVAMLLAIHPLHIEDQPRVVSKSYNEVEEFNLYDPIKGSDEIFTSRSILN